MSEFVLQDSRSNTGDRLMFWAKDGAGYTTNLDAAQRYTKEKATSQNESRESDLPWPLEYLMDRHTLAVDCQNVMLDEVEAQLPTAERCYLYAGGSWNGNDLYWLTNDGDVTDDFSKAHAFPASTAKSMAAPKHHNVHLAPAAGSVVGAQGGGQRQCKAPGSAARYRDYACQGAAVPVAVKHSELRRVRPLCAITGLCRLLTLRCGQPAIAAPHASDPLTAERQNALPFSFEGWRSEG